MKKLKYSQATSPHPADAAQITQSIHFLFIKIVFTHFSGHKKTEHNFLNLSPVKFSQPNRREEREGKKEEISLNL